MELYMEMENSSQPQTAPTPSVVNNPSPATVNQKPLWKTDAFVLLLVVFWPVGLFLMWKYTTWRKRVKILLTLFFSATIVVPIIVVIFMSLFVSSQVQKRSSFGTPPPSSSLTQTPEQSKVYYFQDFGNGYTKVTSTKYTFTFEFPSDLKYYPSFGEPQAGVLESIGFQTEKRQRNDNSASFVISFAPSTTGNPCESYKSLSNWSSTTVNGLGAVKSGTPENQTIIACSGGYNYSFSYRAAYTPNKEGELTPDELVKEKTAYEHILQSFKVTQ